MSCCRFQRFLDLDAEADLHEYIFIDEVGFNLIKRRRRGRNVIGQRAITEFPGQRGVNIKMCAAINHHGVLHPHATLGPYNTALFIAFLDTLYNLAVQPDLDDTGDQVCCCLGQRQGCQGFMHHCRRFFPRCVARENIVSDVDEVLRPARDRRLDAA